MLPSGEPKHLVYVIEDISRRRRVEERLESSLSALVALHEAGRVLSSTLEPEEIGRRLLKIIHGVSDISGAIIKVQDELGRLRVLHANGPEDLWRQASNTPEAEAARHRALETKERQPFRLGQPAGSGTPLTGLCLPLVVGNRLIGVLEIYRPEALTEKTEVETLESMTRQAASALENACLHQEVAERERRLQDLARRLLEAREEERRRVACDIHDGLIQVAVAAHQNLQTYVEAHLPRSPSSWERLDRALQLVAQAVDESRRVIASLRPAALEDSGLGTMLRSRIHSLRMEGWEIAYTEALGEERLPLEIETTLYWIAREALTNVRKHARTTRVAITLGHVGKGVRLEVRDWGRGFDGSAPRTNGMPGEQAGLFGMQERVALLGGEFRIHSQPGAGTSVVAEIPLSCATPVPGDWTSNLRSRTSQARLLVADDHALIREGLRTTLASEPDLEVVAEAKDGKEALELCYRLRPDLVLMDVRMPEMDGLTATKAIRAARCDTEILMLTTYEDLDYLFEAVQAGASGYIIKDAGKRELVSAVRRALNGRNPLNPELAMQLLRHQTREDEREMRSSAPERQPEPLPEALTPRELEILRLVAKGETNRQISRKLIISPATVKVHVEHIIAKLGVSDRTQAAVRACEVGLLDSRD
jgi:DNA-binding NarL/FixJ family response regulator/signal transduction histidine kinase